MLEDWKYRLQAWIDQTRYMRFSWGVHDCFIFTNTAWRKMTGFGYADDWYDRYYNKDYRPLTRKEMQLEFGYSELYEALDQKLERVPVTKKEYGNLVGTSKWSERNTTGVALGICLGNSSVFVGARELQFIPSNEVQFAWGKK